MVTEATASDIRRYVDGVSAEADRYGSMPFIGGRQAAFVYFGGGTPSYLSVDQLSLIGKRLRDAIPWAPDAEVTFECEPGTLKEHKVHAIRAMGVTRISVGVESFDDDLLFANGRAHRAQHVLPALKWCKEAGFPQVNVDLIAGLVGETEATWDDSVHRTLDADPHSVTIYQLEVPGNTTLAREFRSGDGPMLADWQRKRDWVASAFETFEAAGYQVSSGYTVVKPGPHCQFGYRDNLWQGADMLGMGVSAFSHVQGVHFQNDKHLASYLDRVEAGDSAVARGLEMTPDQRLIREWILQLKLGRVRTAHFARRYGVDVLERFAEPLSEALSAGLLSISADEVVLTREALLKVDTLLPAFFQPRHQSGRPRAA